ncbi:hypothetical protein DPV73_14120 [Leptospira mayottensis]|nr:hypothetical protein DPV73_14120 [Leptospira mayottensis]
MNNSDNSKLISMIFNRFWKPYRRGGGSILIGVWKAKILDVVDQIYTRIVFFRIEIAVIQKIYF